MLISSFLKLCAKLQQNFHIRKKNEFYFYYRSKILNCQGFSVKLCEASNWCFLPHKHLYEPS